MSFLRDFYVFYDSILFMTLLNTVLITCGSPKTQHFRQSNRRIHDLNTLKKSTKRIDMTSPTLSNLIVSIDTTVRN